ncbi:maltose acetyltransferase domain-containing protein [Ruminococcus flavefaciens]|uniref:maltose acetyltransferase domain-containing protein n=1 Tax=Ruminococcus flavefaciens TaxID=1265 RepID=UPI0002DF914F
MTEKEKMESGALYSPADKELLNDRIKAKKLCSEFKLRSSTISRKEKGSSTD